LDHRESWDLAAALNRAHHNVSLIIAVPEAMSQLSPTVNVPVYWVLRRRGILLICAVAAGVGFLVAWPIELEIQLILSFDFTAFAHLALFVTLMNLAMPQQAAE
jgi:hypothetical protein